MKRIPALSVALVLALAAEGKPSFYLPEVLYAAPGLELNAVHLSDVGGRQMGDAIAAMLMTVASAP